ncbi:MAG: T9SS type A sorting domain-containing protein [Candidatus Neomarinimicrobiota bacterium]
MKRVILVVLALTLFTSSAFAVAGWQFKDCAVVGRESGSDDQAVNVPGYKNAYGVTVDPDGNIWFGAYYQRYNYDVETPYYPDDVSILVPGGASGGGDTTIVKGTYPIFRLNTDGSYDVFQFLQWDDGVTVDTTWYGNRGMCTDVDGNIVVSTSGGLMYHINYQTGELMATYQNSGKFGHRPAADANGYIYHGDLFGGNPVDVLDSYDFSVYTQVTATQPGAVCRGLSCNTTGTEVYIAGNSGGNGIFKFYSEQGPDGTYALTDTLIKSIMVGSTEMFPGVTCCTYEPSTGYVWFSTIQGDALEAYWAVDPANDAIVDSVSHFFFGPTTDTTSGGYASPWVVRCPRDVAFSNDGLEMYIADMYGYTIKTWEHVDELPELGTAANHALPKAFKLSQNYPNPFNPVTIIPFELANSSMVRLTVYDLTGRTVATLINQNLSAGTHSAEFDGTRLASGPYFYELTIDGQRNVKKMLLLK